MEAKRLTILKDLVLPDECGLGLDDIHLSAEKVEIYVSVHQTYATCHECGAKAERIHSRYYRKIADMSCSGRRMQIRWSVRRFFCDNPRCQKITFAEQVPTFIQRYGRKTERLRAQLEGIGFESGGEGGRRLSNLLSIPTSGDQMLRLVKSHVKGVIPVLKTIGVDDFAFRKGCDYGSILVDLERRCVIDLLPDRQPQTLADWLKKHPEIETISRDRGAGYIQGITQGLPGAVQVVDRFHVLQNLREALQRVLERYPEDLKSACLQILQPSPPALDSGEAEAPPPKNVTKTHRELAFEQVKELQDQGLSGREISRRTGLHRRTIQHYFSLTAPPSKKGRPDRGSKAYPFRSYLQNRIQEGCTNLKTLFQELQGMGFTGSYFSVWRAVQSWGLHELRNGKKEHLPSFQHVSPKQGSWILFQSEDRLEEEDLLWRNNLCCLNPSIAWAAQWAHEFRRMVKERNADGLDPWLKQADTSTIPELVRLAASFRSDYAAIRAGLSSPWSNGQVEGQVNRLKMIKRQMFGRAGFDLLKFRVLGLDHFS